MRAARDRATQVHAWYLRHRFFLKSTDQFLGQEWVAANRGGSDQPKPSSSIRFKSHGHIPLTWSSTLGTVL